MRECFSCGGAFADCQSDKTHAYMSSTASCWSAYGEVLAREYTDRSLFASAHRLTVDAYALQHPGDPTERRALQSFWIHGVSLWLVLRLGTDHQTATAALKQLAGREFPARPAQHSEFASTHAAVLEAPLSDHAAMAQKWAEDTLLGWEAAHDEFEQLAHFTV